MPAVAPSDPPTPAADEAQQRMFTINFVDTNQKAIDAGTESDSRQNNLVVVARAGAEGAGRSGAVRLVRRRRGALVEAVRSLVPDRGVAGHGAVSALIAPRLPVPRSRRDGRFPLRVRIRRSRGSCGRQQALQSRDRHEHRHHGRPAAHRRQRSRPRKRSSGSRCSVRPRRSAPTRSTTSSRRSCRRTGCAWTSTPAWASESSAASSTKADSLRRHGQHAEADDTATARRATAAAAAVAARDRTGLRTDDSDRQVARSADDPQPAAALRQPRTSTARRRT